MPAYPHPPNPQQPPSFKARVRAALMGGLARVVRGRRGARLAPDELASARMLVIRPDHLGDLLFLGPALRWMRQQWPQSHITLAIGPWGHPALPGLTDAWDALITIPFPAFERGTRAGTWQRWAILMRWARRLRAEQFDVALVFRPDHWWGAMLARGAGIPMRWGFDTRETRPWLTHTIPTRREHAVASNLRLAAALAGTSITPDPRTHPLMFAWSPEAQAEARQVLQSTVGEADDPLVVIHPGSGAAVKGWDVAKWQVLARRLGDEGARVVVTGGPGEVELARQVADVEHPRVVSVAGRTRFAALAALLAQATCVVGPDSGPLHLAVAVGTPTVHLYGPSDPRLFGPWGDVRRHRVVVSDWTCAPCGKFDWPDLPAHGCVRDIPVERVWAEVVRVMG